MQRNRVRETAAEKRRGKTFTIAGHTFELTRQEVTRTARRLDPEPIASHYAVVGARRYPPKQIISAVTGLDRADFTSHQARRTLMRLGFPVGRHTTNLRGAAPRDPGSVTDRPGDRLRPFIGQWVAVKDDDVLYAASSPQAVVSWLTTHGQTAGSVFRVPEDDLAGTGLAPL